MPPLKFKDPIRHQCLPGQTLTMIIRHHNGNTNFTPEEWECMWNEVNRLNENVVLRPGDSFFVPVVENDK
jgi:hypothetical protein